MKEGFPMQQSGVSRITRFFTVLAVALAVTGTALAHDYTIYRALSGNVNATPCVTGPKTNPGEFRIDADGLSTFQDGVALLAAKAYRLRFLVQNAPNDPPVQGDTGTVANVNGFAYTATYTPDQGGAGHWSLINAARSPAEMKTDFSEYARAGGNVDRNPNYNDNPVYCPGAPTRATFVKE
jgi:hypothetical protein